MGPSPTDIDVGKLCVLLPLEKSLDLILVRSILENVLKEGFRVLGIVLEISTASQFKATTVEVKTVESCQGWSS